MALPKLWAIVFKGGLLDGRVDVALRTQRIDFLGTSEDRGTVRGADGVGLNARACVHGLWRRGVACTAAPFQRAAVRGER